MMDTRLSAWDVWCSVRHEPHEETWYILALSVWKSWWSNVPPGIPHTSTLHGFYRHPQTISSSLDSAVSFDASYTCGRTPCSCGIQRGREANAIQRGCI